MKVKDMLISRFPYVGKGPEIMSYLEDSDIFKFKRCHYLQDEVEVYHDNRLIASIKGERLYFYGDNYVSVKHMVRLESMVKTAILKTNKH